MAAHYSDRVPGSHYFTSASVDPGVISALTVELAGRDREVFTAPGVFSPGRIDLGTRVLLRSVPAPPTTGALLDLGCGWGPLALTMALTSPDARVWGVDVNPRALDLLRRSAQGLACRNVTPALPDQVPAGERFELIWSNPPIRIGKTLLHELLMRWLPRLSPTGTGYLVVQRNLGADSLTGWLQAALPVMSVAKVASAKGYRVIEIRPQR